MNGRSRSKLPEFRMTRHGEALSTTRHCGFEDTFFQLEMPGAWEVWWFGDLETRRIEH